MRTLLIYIFMGLYALGLAQTNLPTRIQTAEHVQSHFIPKNLKQCFVEIDKHWNNELKKDITNTTEDKFMADADTVFHSWANQRWVLWGNSRLALYFKNQGVYHPKQMSSIILRTYFRNIRKQPLQLKALINKYKSRLKKGNPNHYYGEVEGKTENKSSYDNMDSILFHKDSINYLEFTDILELPTYLHQFKSLKSIDIYESNHTHIEQVFKTLTKIKPLEELYFFDTYWTYLPESIGRIKHLNTLWMDEMYELKRLPSSISKLKYLEDVSFSECPNLDINHTVELITQLPKLKYLDISYYSNLQTPETISQLDSLKSLWMSDNDFKEIPDCIKHFPNLNSLYLGSNALTQVEFSSGDLPNLKTIYLRSNSIKEFPLSLKHLKKLEKIDLDYNEGIIIPKNMGIFSHLKELSLINCNLSKADKDYLKEVLPNTKLNF